MITKKQIGYPLTVFILVLQCASLQNNFTASVTCLACQSSCSSCFRITSDSYDNKFCGKLECKPGTNISLNFVSCSTDSTGQNCSTKLCIIPPVSGCFNSYTSTNNYCAKYEGYWEKLACGTCKTSLCYQSKPTITINSCIQATNSIDDNLL